MTAPRCPVCGGKLNVQERDWSWEPVTVTCDRTYGWTPDQGAEGHWGDGETLEIALAELVERAEMEAAS